MLAGQTDVKIEEELFSLAGPQMLSFYSRRLLPLQGRSRDYGNVKDSRPEAQVRTFNGATESGREGQLA